MVFVYNEIDLTGNRIYQLVVEVCLCKFCINSFTDFSSTHRKLRGKMSGIACSAGQLCLKNDLHC